MPKDYVSRARQSSGKNKRTTVAPRRQVVARKKPKQVRSNVARRNKATTNKARIAWKPIAVLLFLIVLLIMGWHFLKLHAQDVTNIPVENAKSMSLIKEKKEDNIEHPLPRGPLKPVDFQFQALNMVASSKHPTYVLQLGTYAQGDSNLQTLTDNLSGANIPYHLEPFERASQSMIRVEVGPFKKVAQAKQTQTQLLTQQIYSVIKEIK